MAKLRGQPPFIGTRYGVTIYKMWDQYYIRSKSSLTGERVKHDPTFSKTMAYAMLLKLASPIASDIYQLLPVKKKQYAFYRKLTGIVMQWLKQGQQPAQIIQQLLNEHINEPVKKSKATFIRTDVSVRTRGRLSEKYVPAWIRKLHRISKNSMHLYSAPTRGRDAVVKKSRNRSSCISSILKPGSGPGSAGVNKQT